jgi:hypothetical protein
MELNQQTTLDIPTGLLEAIRSFPVQRETEHCGVSVFASPFDFYAHCPTCGTRIKLRSFSGASEIEDLFDAVFAWMQDPVARQAAANRQQQIEAEHDE